MSYQLTQNEYDLMQEYAPNAQTFVVQNQEAYSIPDAHVDDVLCELDDAMAAYGLTANQSEANEVGIRLAHLYDRLFNNP